MYTLIKVWLGARNKVENSSYDLSQAASTGGVTQAPSSMQNAQSTSVSVTVLVMMSYVDSYIHTLYRSIPNLGVRKIKLQLHSVTCRDRGVRGIASSDWARACGSDK